MMQQGRSQECVGSFRVVACIKAALGVGHDIDLMDAEAGCCCCNVGYNEVGIALDADVGGQGYRGIVQDAKGIELGSPLCHPS